MDRVQIHIKLHRSVLCAETEKKQTEKRRKQSILRITAKGL